jgi:hypothetical protein
MGARAMIESYAILILLLALGINWLQTKTKGWQYALGAVVAVFVYFNLIQTWLLSVGLFDTDIKHYSDYWKSANGIVDLIEHHGMMKNNFQLEENKVNKTICVFDTTYQQPNFYVSNAAFNNHPYQNIFSQPLNRYRLKNGDWIRVAGEGYYEYRDATNGNKAVLVFQISSSNESLSWQGAPMPLNTLVEKPKVLLSAPFQFDFKIRNSSSQNNLLQIFFWNDCQVKYWIKSVKIYALNTKE